MLSAHSHRSVKTGVTQWSGDIIRTNVLTKFHEDNPGSNQPYFDHRQLYTLRTSTALRIANNQKPSTSRTVNSCPHRGLSTVLHNHQLPQSSLPSTARIKVLKALKFQHISQSDSKTLCDFIAGSMDLTRLPKCTGWA
ncbi:hypothetical protein DPMN_143293 [Dreissena polymorpha]|uniref:Uncharacterized protein n=1 Tax=Dreissena polymorpha TaxID=45954 RepID=A0A9D4GDC1_DREPO|nr:hypothetical protein DPMN_143293 [Dreissena polymorpha]